MIDGLSWWPATQRHGFVNVPVAQHVGEAPDRAFQNCGRKRHQAC